MNFKPKFVDRVPCEVFDNLSWTSAEIMQKFSIGVRKYDVLQSVSGECMVWPFEITRNRATPKMFRLPISVTRNIDDCFTPFCKVLNRLASSMTVCAEFAVDDAGVKRTYGILNKLWDYVAVSRSPPNCFWTIVVVYSAGIQHFHSLGANDFIFNISNDIGKSLEEEFNESLELKTSVVVKTIRGTFLRTLGEPELVSVAPMTVRTMFPEVDCTNASFYLFTSPATVVNRFVALLSTGCVVIGRSEKGHIFEYRDGSNGAIRVSVDPSVRRRKHWASRIIINAVLCFWKFLPPYCILWILDWFELVCENPEYWKMQLIENVVGNVIRLLNKKGSPTKRSFIGFEE